MSSTCCLTRKPGGEIGMVPEEEFLPSRRPISEDTLRVNHTRDNSREATTAAELEAGEPGESRQREAQSRVGGMGLRLRELYKEQDNSQG